MLGSAALPPPAAADAPTKAFGAVPCVPRETVRFCEGGLSRRVKTFDGVPLDADVTLPPGSNANPRYPLIVFLHGWAGRKVGFAQTRPLAERGYAVLAYSSRGFGDSCGTQASREADPAGCAQGWTHLGDARYEVRDTQHLAGLLADDRLAANLRVGVSGASYGGGQAMMLAALRNRVMLAAGQLVPWTSPRRGIPMSIAGVTARGPWSDALSALVPNGRALDNVLMTRSFTLSPVGVAKRSYLDWLFTNGRVYGYYAPPGVDAGADAQLAYDRLGLGEPYEDDPQTDAGVAEAATFHSPYYLFLDNPERVPAPTLITAGFTDDLFPADEGIRYANRVLYDQPSALVAQYYFDGGHARGQNKVADHTRRTELTNAWLDRHVLRASVPTLSGIEARTQTCPATAPSGGPYRASSWNALSPGEVRFAWSGPKTTDSSATDAAVAAAIEPLNGAGACAVTSAADLGGAATYRLPAAPEGGWTLLGSPIVSADIAPSAQGAMIAARLWDVEPGGTTQTLVARGVYRPHAGPALFQLHPNGWRFAAGHTPKLELLGSDSPYARTSNIAFTALISNLELRLPAAEAPGGAVLAPLPPQTPAGTQPLP